MDIDLEKYSGTCSCGKVHPLTTRTVKISSGALKDIEKYIEESGLKGKRCVIYDENTYKVTEGRHPGADQEIVLDPKDLHANEISTAYVLSILEKDIDYIIAIGTGTVHDISRYCAHDRGISFVSCPTGASVDGFCSTVCSMTWYGYKKTLPAVAPVMVVADTDIFSAAPENLIRSGAGDILAKYTALCDWKIAHAVTGEYLCDTVYGIMEEALRDVAEAIASDDWGSPASAEKVMYALVMSGIAMQMMGNSRPASGCEHHISHMIEMDSPALEVSFQAMHGEKTGVGAVIGSEVYHRMAQTEDISGKLVPYAPADPEFIEKVFGDGLKDAIFEENSSDVLSSVEPEKLIAAWPEIRRIISEVPSPEEIYAMLGKIGAKKDLKDIGVGDDKLPLIIEASPLVRNRLTLMRMRRILRLD